MFYLLLLLVFIAGPVLADHGKQPASGPTAVVAQGTVIGTTTSLPAATATINKFLGVPFAQSPPVRFELPQAPGKFKGKLEATQFKDACTQQFNCEF